VRVAGLTRKCADGCAGAGTREDAGAVLCNFNQHFKIDPDTFGIWRQYPRLPHPPLPPTPSLAPLPPPTPSLAPLPPALACDPRVSPSPHARTHAGRQASGGILSLAATPLPRILLAICCCYLPACWVDAGAASKGPSDMRCVGGGCWEVSRAAGELNATLWLLRGSPVSERNLAREFEQALPPGVASRGQLRWGQAPARRCLPLDSSIASLV